MDNYENKPVDDLYTYFTEDNLTEADKQLLADLDAMDVSTAELAVEFTDDDVRKNAVLLGKIEQQVGHANNVECASYTYVINVYQKDALNGKYLYTRIYEFTDNVAIQLVDLFSTFNTHFIHRSSVESFPAADVPYTAHIEKRQTNVYDLIVPEGFDIDAPHYYYTTTITCFEPWTTTPEGWESTLRAGWTDGYAALEDMNKFTKYELLHLPMLPTTPHVLNTRKPCSHVVIKEKE